MNRLVACDVCGLVQHLDHLPRRRRAVCARCSSTLERNPANSRPRTAALALAALLLYVPANIYPVMIMEYMGRHTENTVWDGVVALYRQGMWGVATIVFMASIVVPLLKLLGLFVLVSSRGRNWRRERTLIYKVIGWIGPWAMLDVFLLSILVALIRFGGFATVIPGVGVIAFTAVVVLTILASASFDPHLIWTDQKKS